jgi:hypothetical protein
VAMSLQADCAALRDIRPSLSSSYSECSVRTKLGVASISSENLISDVVWHGC